MGIALDKLPLKLRERVIKQLNEESVPPRSDGKTAVLERNPSNGALAAKEVQGQSSQRFYVRVTSIRKRLTDESNMCYKYHEDLCRYAGALPSDAPDKCHSEVFQKKAGKDEPEKVIIEIYEP